MAEEQVVEEVESSPFNKIFIIIIIAIVLVVISVTVAWYVATHVNTKPVTKDPKENVETTGEEKEESDELPAEDPLMTWGAEQFEEFKAPIREKEKERVHVIKAKIVLAFEKEDEKIMAELDERKYQIRDLINRIPIGKYYEDVITAEGMKHLSDQITNEINSILQKGKISTVYIPDYIVQ